MINCIYFKDYCNVINENIVFLMKVYMSNYYIEGFISFVLEEELVVFGKEFDLLVISDLGSGLLIDMVLFGLFVELMV